MQNKSFNLIYIIGIFLILITPLLSVPPLFHPPAWGKAILFRSIFAILLFFFAYQGLFKNKENFSKLKGFLTNKKSATFLIAWALLSLIVIITLSTIFSAEPAFSFWGSPFRGGGSLNFILLSLFSIFTFIVLKEKEWRWVWSMNIFVGFVACLIALCQKFRLFGDFLLLYSDRVISTFGGSIFFALYLILLIFLVISLGVSAKKWKRIMYFGLAALFLFCIILSGTRAAMIGFGIGIIFFVFAFPQKGIKIKWAKIILLSAIILGLSSIVFLKFQPQLVNSLSSNKFYGSNFSRIWSVTGNFSIKNLFYSRASGWVLGMKGALERPLLGFGPENFSIPFDKYYDSNLVGLSTDGLNGSDGGEASWWDKGHGFVFDYAATVGIPFLIIYLLLNVLVIWKLRKASENQKPESQIISHGIQATIIGYLITNFFSFDVFSTYLIYFIILGYSFYLLSENNNQENIATEDKVKPAFKKSLLAILFIVLVWFLWSENLKPFLINKEINTLTFLVNKATSCDAIITRTDKLLTQHSILDNYLRLSYIDIIGVCSSKDTSKEKSTEYSYKVLQLLADCIKERPTYTRNWIFQGVHAYNMLNTNTSLDQAEKDRLFKLAYLSYEKSKELSPRRQVTYIGWAKTDLLLNKYDEALAKVDECTNLNPNFNDCWRLKSLIYIAKGNIEEGTKILSNSFGKGGSQNIYSDEMLSQLVNLYSGLIKKTGDLKYYGVLANLFKELIVSNPNNFQYHASLAFTYKALGQYDDARKEAAEVVRLSPDSKAAVEAFLKTLPK